MYHLPMELWSALRLFNEARGIVISDPQQEVKELKNTSYIAFSTLRVNDISPQITGTLVPQIRNI